jgi:hypothetical protein
VRSFGRDLGVCFTGQQWQEHRPCRRQDAATNLSEVLQSVHP